MSRCPVCESQQIVIVIGPQPSAWCDRCGARWIQEGSEQRRVKRAQPSSVLVEAI
jgi:uncharacterized paraquat-inducible protein A